MASSQVDASMMRSALSFSKAFTVRIFYVSFYKQVPKILEARISILGVLYAHAIVFVTHRC
jgi:hypothetical protein